MTGPRFGGPVAAAISLVEAPSNSGKAATVAMEVMAIKLRNKTGLSIEKFLEAPFAGKRHQGGGGRSGSDSRRSHRRGRLGRDQAPGC